MSGLQNTDLYDEETGTYWQDDTTFCEHGTYIGTPGGPDILCGYCESGISVEELIEQRLNERRRTARNTIETVVTQLRTLADMVEANWPEDCHDIDASRRIADTTLEAIIDISNGLAGVAPKKDN